MVFLQYEQTDVSIFLLLEHTGKQKSLKQTEKVSQLAKLEKARVSANIQQTCMDMWVPRMAKIYWLPKYINNTVISANIGDTSKPA